MSDEKVVRELVERLAQSAYYLGIHRNEEWEKALITNKQAIINYFKKIN